MEDKEPFWDEKERKYIDEDEETKRRFPSFILICLFTTVGIVLALGFSLSAIGLLKSNETINSLISSLTGDDNKDKYIITYIENEVGKNGENYIIKDGTIHITSAKVSNTSNGGQGEVVFFGGVLLTTKNTFVSKDSTITYEVKVINDGPIAKKFSGLIFNKNGSVKYSVAGLNIGDMLKPGEEVTLQVTVAWNGNRDVKFPTTVESSVDVNFREENKKLHIVDANVKKESNGGHGEVVYFEGLSLDTKNTFDKNSSSVTYEVKIKNDTDSPQKYTGLIYDKDSGITYKVVGLNPGDTLKPGDEVTVELVVEYKGDANSKYPVTKESNVNFDFESEDKNLHIVDAKVESTKNGAKGKVVYFEDLTLETKNTFTKGTSSVTYEVKLKNDSSKEQTFDGLIYNKDSDVKYTLTGLNPGDTVKPGDEVIVHLTVEYVGNEKYPVTKDTTVNFDFSEEKNETLHIVDAKENGSQNGGHGEVVFYEGLHLETKNSFENKDSKIGYKVVIKNDSNVPEVFDGLIFDPNGDVKYTITGIKEGDILEPGESVTVYLQVEPNGNLNYPTTIDSAASFNFTTFTVNNDGNGINLVNQFPTRDEVGKLFEGKNYVYTFTLIIGKKTVGAYYELTAVENNDNTLNPNYVKLYLEKNGTGVDMSYNDNKRVKVFTDYSKSEHDDAVGKVIYKGYISDEDAKRGKIDFKMRMWVSEDVRVNETNMQEFNNKKFGVKVNTYAMFER